MPIINPVTVGIARFVVVRGSQAFIAYYAVTEGGEAIGDALAEADILDEEQQQQIEDSFIEAGETIVEGLSDAATEIVGTVGGWSLDFVRGLASAIIEGIDAAYDVIRNKLRGREPDVIAGFTVGSVAILAAVWVYQSVKAREI